MTGPDLTADGLAETHGAAFDGHGWPSATFAGYLSDPKILLFGSNRCFVAFRVLPPEAEILTLATHPADQGLGHASRLLPLALSALRAQGIADVFLDVSEQNTAARALYAKCGFEPFAERRNYYADETTAICMKAVLSTA